MHSESDTDQIAIRQFEERIRGLLLTGQNEAAIVELCSAMVTGAHEPIIKQLLFDAFFQKRDWAPAIALAKELHAAQPDSAARHKALVITLSNSRQFDQALIEARNYIGRFGEELAVLDVLKVVSFYTGKIDEAVRYGQRILEERDAAGQRIPAAFQLTETGSPPTGRNVISFSLWGTKPTYVYGAMINMVLSRAIYPGWTCRYYVGDTVPAGCVSFLRDNGAEIYRIEDDYPGVGLFQRFLVMNDRSVGRFLVRDCDARLSAAEADLVKEWIESGYPFHVIRDHPLHTEPMIGCTWAGRTDCNIDIVELTRRYFQRVGGVTARYGHDQFMLGLDLWPIIRSRCLVHDKHYRLEGVKTVQLRDPSSHFGAGHQNLDHVIQEVERLGIPKLK